MNFVKIVEGKPLRKRLLNHYIKFLWGESIVPGPIMIDHLVNQKRTGGLV
jgi:hypothetical protein